VRSVASVFVSRIDTVVDNLLDKMFPEDLKGKAAVANSRIIYDKFLEIFSSEEFKALKARGVNAQRVLWGSTSAKNPAYSDIKYVTELIAPDTVNTLPIKTFNAFLDHGKVENAMTPENIKTAREDLQKLKNTGIDIDEVCNQLLKDGVDAFVKSYDSLLGTLDQKQAMLCAR
jgi:transaldolase